MGKIRPLSWISLTIFDDEPPKRKPKGVKTIFRRGDNKDICYSKCVSFLPRILGGEFCWFKTIWIRFTYTGFDMVEGPQWQRNYLSRNQMIQERLTHNLVEEATE